MVAGEEGGGFGGAGATRGFGKPRKVAQKGVAKDTGVGWCGSRECLIFSKQALNEGREQDRGLGEARVT